MSEDKYYAVRMLWVRDQQAWDKYQEIAKPISEPRRPEIANFCLWLQADILMARNNVRYTPNRCYEAEGSGFMLLRLFHRQCEGARCYDTVCSGYHSRTHTPCRA